MGKALWAARDINGDRGTIVPTVGLDLVVCRIREPHFQGERPRLSYARRMARTRRLRRRHRSGLTALPLHAGPLASLKCETVCLFFRAREALSLIAADCCARRQGQFPRTPQRVLLAPINRHDSADYVHALRPPTVQSSCLRISPLGFQILVSQQTDLDYF
jgi:hypothetical protein